MNAKFRFAMWAGLLSSGMGLAMAQDEPTATNPPADSIAMADEAAPALTQFRRVPPYFGQIGLTPDQRERIYDVRGVQQAKIAELKRQIEELETAEMSDCESVLTDAQRKLLENRRDASRQKRAATAAK